MCGISGITIDDCSLVEQMNAVQKHRGPDHAGIFSDGQVTLGHTLLSIRGDLGRSQQPVYDKLSPWVLAFNGQIYNTTELAQGLDGDWENETLDTIILYEVIKEYGWDFIRRIQGMYAMAVYNCHEKRLRLYRDASGQKPVYYSCNKAKLIFASEIKAILEDSSIQREPDQEGIQWAARAGYIPSRHTMLECVKKLLPGEMLEWNHGSAEIKLTELDPEPSYADTQEGLGKWMPQLIGEHLQSRQKVALSLSGGMDSSVLLHEMREHGYSIASYTSYYVGASEASNSDAPLAARLAREYGAEHREVEVTKEDFWDRFISCLKIIEEPNYNLNSPLYLKMAEVQGQNGDGVRVILTGCGGDELFYGYPHHDQNYHIDRWLRVLPPWLLTKAYQLRHGRTVRFESSFARWAFNRQLDESYLLEAAEDFATEKSQPDWVQAYMDKYAVSDEGVYQGLLMDRLGWMAGESFVRSDKLYMSQSVEVRCPLSHTPLRQAVDKATHHLPYQGARSQKAFLRRHYEGRLPDYIVKRGEKTAYRAPVSEWYDSNARDLYLSLFSGRRGPFIDWKKLESKVLGSREWPGRVIQVYASIAVLSDHLGVEV